MEDISNKTKVTNAGLILCNAYLPMLFERIGIMQNHQFLKPEDNGYAVRCLHYLAAGQNNTGELQLPLANILCQLPLLQVVEPGGALSGAHCDIIKGLIESMINYWPAIGSSSIDGFRGNWLLRDGLLTEQDDQWVLIVEKRAYDVLISKSPFSFSIIKYPWMTKPLHVTWPY